MTPAGVDLRYSPAKQDMSWLFKAFPGFLARSRANPASVENFDVWKQKLGR
jgi:hypothetical protein